MRFVTTAEAAEPERVTVLPAEFVVVMTRVLLVVSEADLLLAAATAAEELDAEAEEADLFEAEAEEEAEELAAATSEDWVLEDAAAAAALEDAASWDDVDAD